MQAGRSPACNFFSGCKKTPVGASIARPCPFVLQENCPRKCVAAVSWRVANGRPCTFNRQECDFLEERNLSKQLAAQRLAGAGEREVGKLLIVKGAAQDRHIHISQ